MEILLDGGVQVGSSEEECGGRAAEADVGGGFVEDEGVGETFGGVAQVAAAGLGFLGRLAADAAVVVAVLLRVDGLEEGCLSRIGLEGQGMLPLGGIGEGLGRLLGGLELTDAFGNVHLGTLGVRPGGSRNEDAFAGPDGEPAVGAQFETAAAPSTPGGAFGSLVDQMAQAQLAGVFRGGEAGAQLPGGIVDDPLVETSFMVMAHPAG